MEKNEIRLYNRTFTAAYTASVSVSAMMISAILLVGGYYDLGIGIGIASIGIFILGKCAEVWFDQKDEKRKLYERIQKLEKKTKKKKKK